MNYLSSVGFALRETRKKHGVSIREVAARMGGDYSPTYITKIEIHDVVPSIKYLVSFAKVLGLSKDEYLSLLSKAKELELELVLDKYHRKYAKYEREIQDGEKTK